MERIVSKGDDFVVDTLFYFKPVERFEYRGDMFSFGGSSYCASKEQGSFAITGDEIFVFVVSLGRVSCNSLI